MPETGYFAGKARSLIAEWRAGAEHLDRCAKQAAGDGDDARAASYLYRAQARVDCARELEAVISIAASPGTETGSDD